MADGIVEYLETERSSFEESPLCEVDSLVLSTIAYLNFENGPVGQVVPSQLLDLPVALCGARRSDLLGATWLMRMDGERFLLALLESPRFMRTRVGYYTNVVSSHFEKQFSAITFFLPDGTAYVAYRGTDSSLAGWKEDFNLTFMSEVPSQTSARTYLEDITGTSPAALYVGGHSKGGNLAEYAALTCREQTFDKIQRIYNHDGPGFAFEPGERMRSQAYRKKLRKTVPESSVFGMLMESRADYSIVKSSGFLFAQHATTHWHVKDGKLESTESLSLEASALFTTLNRWALMYEPAQRGQFIDAVYEVFESANIESWSELKENPSTYGLALVEAAVGQPAGVRSMILGMLRDLASVWGSEAFKRALASALTATFPEKA